MSTELLCNDCKYHKAFICIGYGDCRIREANEPVCERFEMEEKPDESKQES